MKKLFLFLFALILILPSVAHAQLRVDITQGMSQPLPVAITKFHASSPAGEVLANQIPDVVSSDLAASGLFKPVNPAAFVQDVASIAQSGPRFAEWRATGAQGLITGSVTDAGGGKARVEFRLWDVFGQ